MLSTMRRRLPAMGSLFAPVLALVVSGMLAGCGGAVEKAVGNLLDETKVPYSLSQNTADCKATEPGSACTDVKIYATKRHDGPVTVRPIWTEIPDNNAPVRVIDHVYRDNEANGDVRISVGFMTQMRPGVYTGTIEINILSLELFTNYVPNKVRYRLEVGNNGTENLTTLPAVMPGRESWSGFGGGGTRSGYVPLSLDATKFSPRWTRWIATPANTYGEGLHLGQGLIAVPDMILGSGGATTSNATVMSLKDGTDLWKGLLPDVPIQVTGRGDRLYWQASNSRVMVTSTTAGTLVGEHTAKGNTVVAPGWTFAGGRLLMPTDPEVNYLSALDVADIKTPVWTTTVSDRIVGVNYSAWGATADVDAGLTYVNTGGVYRVLRLSDGVITAEAQVPTREDLGLGQVWSYEAPVLPEDGVSAVLLSHRDLARGTAMQNHLTVVDRATGAQRWDATGQFMDHPVTAHGVVYAANQSTKAVEARSLADGSLLWTWAMPTTDSFWQRQMVLTDTHLFVSTDKQTVAIDLATRTAAWQVATGGWLGMTPEGVLVLYSAMTGTGQLSTVKTFNLR
ncbi:hypothetical protein [Roseateles sp. L2-2]|uniref:hypothetical protein n=1 Tax=Roseateles TaxID=93681 RepID=UPI003D35E526